MGVLTVRLPDEVHEKWATYCSGLGLKPAKAIRLSIEQQVAANDAPMKPVRAGTGGKNKIQVKVQITESEREGIRLRTHLHGGTRSGWIAKAIRSALTQAPIIGEEQAEIVKASNHQLLKLGININQIARRLNEYQGTQIKAVELAELQELRQQIDAHVSKMEALVSIIHERGELEES